MATQTTQLRVTLPIQLQAYLQAKASKFGLSLSAYVKNLIINDVQNVEYPVYKASPQIEDSYRQAMKVRDKAIEVDDLDEYFENL